MKPAEQSMVGPADVHASLLSSPPIVHLPPAPGSSESAGSAEPGRARDDRPRPATASAPAAENRPGFFARMGHRLEAFVSELSTRNRFWNRLCSWIWLPLAFRSGIKFHKGSESTFSAVLPFRRFNRNWYNAMAGGALLGNAEVAGGMFVFEHCGGDYTVVCKELTYKFLLPCHGPAVYRIEPREDIKSLVRTGNEFNITVDMGVVQMVQAKGQRERRVGNCTATFHVTPKSLVRERAARRRRRAMAR